MQVLLDHATAVVVGAVLFLILAAVQLRSAEDVVDSASTAAHRATALPTLEVLEHDLRNLGAGTPAGAAPILAWDLGGGGVAFRTTVDPAGTAGVVRYRLVEAGPARFRLERAVNLGAGFTPAGGSAPSLTALTLVPLRADGTPSAAPYADAVAVAVEAASSAPYGDRPEGEIRWRTVVRPRNLAR